MAEKYLSKEQNTADIRQVSKKKLSNMFIACFFWLALWQLIAMAVSSTLLLPSPVETVAALGDLAVTQSFYADVAWTIFRCVLAMALSFVLGVVAAWLSYKSSAVRSLLALPVGFFKAVPVMAVVIYLILLMKSNWVAVAACFLMCFPIVYTNVLTGLDAVSNEFLELVKIYRLNAMQVIRLVYVPSIMSQVKAAVKLIAGLSWKAVVAAEVLSIPAHSLGYGMMNAKYYLETPTLFAYVIVIIVLSMAMEKIINIGLERLDSKGYEGSKLDKLSLNDLSTVDTKNGEKDAYTAESEDVIESFLNAVSEDYTNIKTAPRINVQNLSKAFGDKMVLAGLTKTFEAGKVSVLKGPSGSGKTTLVRILAGLETADSGSVEFSFDKSNEKTSNEKADIKKETIDKSAFSNAVKLSYLFQEDRLLPWLNVYDNLALSLVGKCSAEDISVLEGNQYCSGTDSYTCLNNALDSGMYCRIATDKFDANRIVQMAKALEIEDALWKLPGELSGGMKHRVALGRTFLAHANVMILDEPLRGLDDELKSRIVDRLWEPCTKGKTVILITHNEQDLELIGAER